MSKTHRVSNRAPSWSWPSLDGEVMFPKYSDHTSYKPQAEVKMMKLDYFQDSFGAVKSGFARMRGQLCRAIVTSSEEHGNEFSQKDAKGLKLLGSGHTVDCDEVIFDDPKETRNLGVGQGQNVSCPSLAHAGGGRAQQSFQRIDSEIDSGAAPATWRVPTYRLFQDGQRQCGKGERIGPAFSFQHTNSAAQ